MVGGGSASVITVGVYQVARCNYSCVFANRVFVCVCLCVFLT